MMDIKGLINRYFEGETTPDEEVCLRDYLATHEVASDMQCDKELILGLHDTEPALPQGLEARLSAKIDELAAEENGCESKKQGRAKIFNLSRPQWAFVAVAASFFIIFMLGIPGMPDSAHRDTFDSPETASVEAGKALAFFSKKMTAGVMGVKKVREVTGNVNEQIEKHFKPNEDEE